jgi:hypothetical protein
LSSAVSWGRCTRFCPRSRRIHRAGHGLGQFQRQPDRYLRRPNASRSAGAGRRFPRFWRQCLFQQPIRRWLDGRLAVGFRGLCRSPISLHVPYILCCLPAGQNQHKPFCTGISSRHRFDDCSLRFRQPKHLRSGRRMPDFATFPRPRWRCRAFVCIGPHLASTCRGRTVREDLLPVRQQLGAQVFDEPRLQLWQGIIRVQASANSIPGRS